jgi:hypothetical protein
MVVDEERDKGGARQQAQQILHKLFLTKQKKNPEVHQAIQMSYIAWRLAQKQ